MRVKLFDISQLIAAKSNPTLISYDDYLPPRIVEHCDGSFDARKWTKVLPVIYIFPCRGLFVYHPIAVDKHEFDIRKATSSAETANHDNPINGTDLEQLASFRISVFPLTFVSTSMSNPGNSTLPVYLEDRRLS